jgi:hypothetical protein
MNRFLNQHVLQLLGNVLVIVLDMVLLVAAA